MQCIGERVLVIFVPDLGAVITTVESTCTRDFPQPKNNDTHKFERTISLEFLISN
jgi:hypothetical protein